MKDQVRGDRSHCEDAESAQSLEAAEPAVRRPLRRKWVCVLLAGRRQCSGPAEGGAPATHMPNRRTGTAGSTKELELSEALLHTYRVRRLAMRRPELVQGPTNGPALDRMMHHTLRKHAPVPDLLAGPQWVALVHTLGLSPRESDVFRCIFLDD